jgi:hypothetical protein
MAGIAFGRATDSVKLETVFIVLLGGLLLGLGWRERPFQNGG